MNIHSYVSINQYVIIGINGYMYVLLNLQEPGMSRSDKPGQNARLGERAVKAIESFIRGKKLPSILCKMSVFKGRDEYIFVLICRATS